MKHARPDYDIIQEASRIPADEPVFLIRGQDVVGVAAVRAWADLAEAAGASPDILAMAREHADKMAAWPKKKTPDLPKLQSKEPEAVVQLHMLRATAHDAGFTIWRYNAAEGIIPLAVDMDGFWDDAWELLNHGDVLFILIKLPDGSTVVKMRHVCIVEKKLVRVRKML